MKTFWKKLFAGAFLISFLSIMSLCGCTATEVAFFLAPPGSQSEADLAQQMAVESVPRYTNEYLASIPQQYRMAGSNLYYDKSIGKVVYERPDGVWFHCELSGLKMVWIQGE